MESEVPLPGSNLLWKRNHSFPKSSQTEPLTIPSSCLEFSSLFLGSHGCLCTGIVSSPTYTLFKVKGHFSFSRSFVLHSWSEFCLSSSYMPCTVFGTSLLNCSYVPNSSKLSWKQSCSSLNSACTLPSVRTLTCSGSETRFIYHCRPTVPDTQ